MHLGLDGRRALVIGASQGLGAAIARSLLEEGAEVDAASRRPDAIQAWRADLPDDRAARLSAHHVDLARPASVADLADRLGERGVDVLINNCGGPPPGSAADATADAWNDAFAAMASSIFALTAKLLPAMRSRRWGRVVTVGSSGIVQPIPNLALSNAVRGAVAGWSKTLAEEVAADGVTVNIVLPGRIDTDRVRHLDSAKAAREGQAADAVRRTSIAGIPMRRYGDPAEFAAMVCFLASDRAGYVTGSMVRVDGGLIRAV